MKRYWQKIALKIDALSLRERVIIFAMAVLVLLVLVNNLLLDPQYAQQKQLSERIRQNQTAAAALQSEIRQKALSRQDDPDAANRDRLQQLQQQFNQMQTSLGDMQKGLVPPERIPALLEDMLRQNGSLHLVSLTTLPVSALVEPPKAVPGEQPKAVSGNVYKHGVELVIRGQYLDMMNYLAQLESMPWQLFWSRASLKTDEYPESTLTLTVYTLSLDGKWLKL